jgi:hypothetical protein
VLLVAAGLLIASFDRLTSLDPGFEPRELVAADVSLPGAKYRDEAARFRFHEEVLDRCRPPRRAKRRDGDAGADEAEPCDARRLD